MKRRRALALVVLAFSAASTILASSPAEVSPQRLRRAAKLSANGTKALGLGNWREAERLFREALEAVPVFPDAHLGIGHLAMRERRFDDALSSFERARDGYTRMQGFVFAERMKNHEESQRQLVHLRTRLEQLRQLESQPGTESPERALETARLEQEIVHLEQVRPPTEEELAAPPPELQFFIGNALMHLGRVDEAIGSWEAAIAGSPRFAPAYNNLAIAHARLGRIEEARRCLQKAEALGLDVPDGLESEIERMGREAGRAP